MTKNVIIKGLFLMITFLIYSGSSVLSKIASIQDLGSYAFFASIVGVVALLGVYAILWQKVLSFMDLNKAFLYKSVTILIVLCASTIFFGEKITFNNIIGAAIIIGGIVVLSLKR